MIEVTISNMKCLANLTEEESDRIKSDLSIINPLYVNAKKYSRWVNTKIPKYLFYYSEIGDLLLCPTYYEIPFPFEVVEDTREEVTVSYPKFVLELRETQKEAVKAYLKDPEKGIVVMPTGKGKSILGIYLSYILRQKTLVIVHKDDLVDGWNKDIDLCFEGKVKAGLIKAKSRKVGEQITIATIQTLSRMSSEELANYTSQFGLVIVDEQHHVSARTYSLINDFTAPYKIGLSATPERADGLTQVMFWYLGQICYQYEENENDVDILPVKVICREVPISYVPLVEYEGEIVSIFDVPREERPIIPFNSIDSLIVTNKVYKDTVLFDVLAEFRKEHSIIMFFTQKEHCREYFNLLVDNGIPEDKIQLFYGDSTEASSVIKERAENKEVLITIATLGKATEGTNVKSWEVAFLISSMSSGKNVEQAVGRIRRAKEGKINPTLVYDYRCPKVYSVGSHGKSRDSRYQKLGFTISKNDKRDGIFYSRGYRK